jgi:hypothetical protein
MDFQLWLEFEVWREAGGNDDPQNEIFNMQIAFPDGRKYALNVWTYGAFPRIVADAGVKHEESDDSYLLPPDLFVDRLDRRYLEIVVADLVEHDHLRNEWLVVEDE